MAEKTKVREWQVPAYGKATPEAVCEWAKRQIADGRDYWEASPGYQQLEESIRILSGRPSEDLAKRQKDGKYSKLMTNRLKRNLREMVNSLADVRFTPGYHSDATEYQDQATMFNRLAASWYADRFIDIKIKRAVQWMAITPCGWLEICYRRLPGERDRSEIDVIARSAFDVVMTGVPEDGDFQEAYTVTIIKDLPVYLAHSTWPEKQDELIPDRESPKGWKEKIKEFASEVFSEAPDKTTAKNPTCRLYYQHVIDLAINESGTPMKMGFGKNPTTGAMDMKTPWSYEVPSKGQRIKAGYDTDGNEVFRVAESKDCRIFPGRRLLVLSERMKVPVYDGPMFEWHGKVPLVKLTADSWPFGDFSMVHDVAPIHETVQELERIAHQTARNRFWPTLLYNIKSIAREKAKGIRTDVSGQRVGFNGDQGNDPVKPLLPINFYTIDEWYQNFLKYLIEAEDYQMGVKDISAMAKMRVGASADSMEKMLEAAGPIVKGISRDMERSMRDLAEMYKFLVLQYKTTPAIVRVVGVDGASAENFDWLPGNLVPSHLQGENKDKPSIFSDAHRAKWLGDHISFFITPNTMHEIVQTSQKLIYLQLWRGGFPISPWDLAEVLHLPNFGKKPEGTNSMLERWKAWKEMEMEQQLAMQAKMQALTGEAGGDQGGGQGTGPKGGFSGGKGGRAPSGGAMPQIKTKGDGRPVVTESK